MKEGEQRERRKEGTREGGREGGRDDLLGVLCPFPVQLRVVVVDLQHVGMERQG